MDTEFWQSMWESGKVGFHQDEINAYLKDYWHALGLHGPETVLVPLCGKTLDMLWLKALGHSIVGVELSQKAFDEFVLENNLSAKKSTHPVFSGYELDSMSLLCGDFFHLTAADCLSVSAVYDRAALVALPPFMRQDYVAHLKMILPQNHQILLIVMEYDQTVMVGPPFSVSEEEIRRLYGEDYLIKKLASFEIKRKGYPVLESVFKLELKI